MSSLAKLAVSYSVSLSDNRSAVERVIEAIARMSPDDLLQAESLVFKGAGSGFFCSHDPTKNPPLPYSELSEALARSVHGAESGSESRATSTPDPQGPAGARSAQEEKGLKGQSEQVEGALSEASNPHPQTPPPLLEFKTPQGGSPASASAPGPRPQMGADIEMGEGVQRPFFPSRGRGARGGSRRC